MYFAANPNAKNIRRRDIVYTKRHNVLVVTLALTTNQSIIIR